MMMNEILLAFVPMFFAMDPVGILPVFAGLTAGYSAKEKRKVIIQSLITASLLAVIFVFFGHLIFKFLGIGMGDFMVAGGAILFCLSILDLSGRSKSVVNHEDSIGAVPIGTPLIVGPAVLTMCLIQMTQYGLTITLSAVFLNMLIVGILFFFADFFISILGKNGSRALSKVLYLLLAAIGVMMMRRGIMEMIATYS